MVGRGGGICSKNHSGRQNELNIYLGEKEKLSQRHFPNIYIYMAPHELITVQISWELHPALDKDTAEAQSLFSHPTQKLSHPCQLHSCTDNTRTIASKMDLDCRELSHRHLLCDCEQSYPFSSALHTALPAQTPCSRHSLQLLSHCLKSVDSNIFIWEGSPRAQPPKRTPQRGTDFNKTFLHHWI